MGRNHPFAALIIASGACLAVVAGLLAVALARPLEPEPGTTTPASSPTAEPAEEGVIWSADFETGDFSQWFRADEDVGFQNTGTGLGEITTEVAHSGHYAARLAISDADGAHDHQAVRLFRASESRRLPEAYYSVWFYFPVNYRPAVWWNLFQFKSRSATRNDPFWLLSVGNRADGAMFFYLYDWINEQGYHQAEQNIPVGQWTHMEVYYKQSAIGDGRITVWQDGVMLFDVAGITTQFADAVETANWSVNNYTDNISPGDAVIYIDDAVISTRRVGPRSPS